jgi:hypothetical protein
MNALMPVTQRKMPEQDANRILLHATRFQRAAEAQRKWAEPAKKAVDYYEGRQWSAADLAKLAAEKRPALTLNKIRPIVNLVLGYQINNRSDIKFMPGYDGTGMAEIASALTHVEKEIAERNLLPFVGSEVFMDGVVAGRGFYDSRMDFSQNKLGEVKVRAQDPFSTYPDPDGLDYDLNTGAFVCTSRMVSPEEVGLFYGKSLATMVGPFMQAGGVTSGLPSGYVYAADEITPVRSFAQNSDKEFLASHYADYFHDWIDAARKSVRLVDMQHYVLTRRWFFVDLETGDQRPVPDSWTPDQVKKTLAWARAQGEPLVVQEQLVRRVRWTHLIGDVIAFDDWSPYDTFTITGFFPYFRRGTSQGLVEHLTDAQDEVNKRRSARLNLLGRASAAGWQYEKGSLDAQQKRNLERFGSTPGINIEWDSKNGSLSSPKPISIEPAQAGVVAAEKDAAQDLKEIAGVNDAAMGQVDQSIMSGRAIQARQRQALVGLEGFISNFHRSTQMLGKKHLELIQQHYTERRIIRVTGAGNTPVQVAINERTAGGIVNDVTLGSYAVAVTETPISKTFLEAQFQELMEMKQMGMPIPDDFLIDASSVERKEEMKMAVNAARQQQAAAAVAAPPAAPGKAAGPGPGGSRLGRDGGSLPAGPEPGAPPAGPSITSASPAL